MNEESLSFLVIFKHYVIQVCMYLLRSFNVNKSFVKAENPINKKHLIHAHKSLERTQCYLIPERPRKKRTFLLFHLKSFRFLLVLSAYNVLIFQTTKATFQHVFILSRNLSSSTFLLKQIIILFWRTFQYFRFFAFSLSINSIWLSTFPAKSKQVEV